jgi:predicted acylesterase/phospholipase RssA
MGPSALLALIVAAAASPPAAGETTPFSLTLQGAASLGTYEAAVNWTLIRLIRSNRLEEDSQRGRLPRLEALSGSSAGSVNALLAAALWCEADDEVDNLSVDRNLLRDAWLAIGLDELLPGDPHLYTPSDGLFAASAFTPVVDSVQSRVFSGTGLRFKPGCRVPVGFTMTRVVPQLRTVSGLRVKSQQTVVPLIFEVDRTGVPRLRRDTGLRSTGMAADTATLADATDASGPYIAPGQAIQALLASAAFPVAFGARPVCECRRACGDGQREVTPDQCPGPLPGKPLEGLTCSAYSAARGGQEFKLCRSNFIDGGFLDNAPVGLAIEQAEAFSSPRTLRPLTVLLVDPNIRRPREEPPPAPERAVQGFSDAVQMGNDLVNTAREQRLAEAIVSRHWNLTTRALLFRTAAALATYRSIVSQLEAGPASAGAEPAAVAWRPAGQERGPVGRLIARCLRHRPLGGAELEACAATIQGKGGNLPAALNAGARAQGTAPLSPDEVLRLAEDLLSFIEGLGSTARGTGLPLRSTVAVGALAFLADELVPYAQQVGSESALQRMRAACLRSASAVRTLAAHAIEVSRPSLADALRELTAGGAPSGIAEPAAQALATLGSGSSTQLFSSGLLSSLRAALTGVPETSLPEATRAATRRVLLLGELRPRIAVLSDAALQLSQDASEIQSDVRGQRRLLLATRFTPLAGEKLQHFAGFMDRPLRELDYYTGIYEGLHGMAVLICAAQDPYLASRPLSVLKADGSGEPDQSNEQTQRCLGGAMGKSIEYLQILASPKAGPVVRALARRELAASLGSSAEAERLAATPEWSWLGAPPDLRAGGAMGTALAVLLEPAVPCTVSAKEALCPVDLTFEQFLERLRVAGYRPESKAMRAALAGQGRWLSQTLRRALDRAATVEIAQASPESSSTESASTRKAMNAVIGGGETVSRAAERTGDVSFQIDPSTIPLHPLADGSYVPIALAHLVPYRVALDVVGGSIALSWLEPRLQLGRWFSVESTLQVIDLQFSPDVVSSTLGVRGALHLGPLGIASGPRWSLDWGGGSHFGVEFDVTILQDRVGVSFGFRDVSGGNWNTPFVALTIADLNGTLYWLIPAAWRSGR